jgi:hypothetical protein
MKGGISWSDYWAHSPYAGRVPHRAIGLIAELMTEEAERYREAMTG